MFNQVEPKRKQHCKLIEWFLENGADVNHPDRGGHTPLEFASLSGNQLAVLILLEHGAKVTRSTKYLSMKLPSALEAADGYPLLQRRLLLQSELERKDEERKEKERKVAEIKAHEKQQSAER